MKLHALAARTSHRRAALALAGLACTASLAAASGAQAATAVWTCSADAVTAQVAGGSILNPVTASRTPCSDQTVGLPNTTNAIGLAPTINAKSAYAITTAAPPSGKPMNQTINGSAGVEGLTLQTAAGTVVIGVGAATSSATASCKSGKAVLSGKSQMVDLTINGQTVTLDGLLSGVLNPITNSPLGGVISVKLNEQIVSGETLVQRAAHIRVLSALGASPLAEVIIAQSTVSSSSACDPNADGNKDTTGTSLDGICPAGSTLNAAQTLCIIPASQTGGQGTIVVGKPYTGPSGGTVISLNEAIKRYGKNHPCLKGSGPKYAIVGTSKFDRITGTNDRDRILGLGGNDSLDGGRGDDCIEGNNGNDRVGGGIGNDKTYGGSGGDTLTGNLGNDYMDGGTGGDKVNGGPGNDTLIGGTGKDIINAGYGKDVVRAGSGNDVVNVAVQGPSAKVDCGSGRDKIRLNQRELKTIKHCEITYVLADNTIKS